MPQWNIFMLSVSSCSLAVCIEARSRALPMWVKPVPDTRQRAGSWG